MFYVRNYTYRNTIVKCLNHLCDYIEDSHLHQFMSLYNFGLITCGSVIKIVRYGKGKKKRTKNENAIVFDMKEQCCLKIQLCTNDRSV